MPRNLKNLLKHMKYLTTQKKKEIYDKYGMEGFKNGGGGGGDFGDILGSFFGMGGGR